MKGFLSCMLIACCLVAGNASQLISSPLLLNSPYALSYPYLSAPLITPYAVPSLVPLKYEDTKLAEKAETKSNNDEKEKLEKPQVVSVLPYPLAVATAAVPRVLVVSPTAPLTVPGVQSQFHAQDELGQYRYGYNSPLVAKEETKTFDGITRGSYSYIDANGEYQTAAYVSDALGFRIAATNIPKQVEPAYIDDAPDVAEAKAKLFALQAEASQKAAESPATE
uniref:CSON012403 protein n=1 Tax=Culicoides sonorensis TaxID=179676 RepID=A0A336M801_CULSO